MVWVTAYDYPTARAAETAGVDMILVGDSGLMVQYGHTSTTVSDASVDNMLLMTSSVRRGAPSSFVVGDMPIGSYEPSDAEAVRSALRFLSEGQADAVKLEGGKRMAERVNAISNAGVFVVAHIGLTPQSAARFGGYRVQGTSTQAQEELALDLLSLQEAGASAALVEAVPSRVGEHLAKIAEIPVFGIGAGQKLDGQLLILHDILGLYPNFRPKFAQSWFERGLQQFLKENTFAADPRLGIASRETLGLITCIINEYASDVRDGAFPASENLYEDKQTVSAAT